MKPMIYAHRGASGHAPENTLKAFSLGKDLGADGVELDVQRTRDGVLVVFHDETVDRVTNGHGHVCDMTLAELKKLRVCRTFPDQPGEEIPTLEETYTLLHEKGLLCNAELKNSVVLYEGLEEACLEMAAKTGMTDSLLYSSFNHVSMARLKRISPTTRCALLYEGVMVEPWTYAAKLGVDALHPHFGELQRAGECEAAHALSIEVNPWTVNEEQDIRNVIAAGADRIITNFPERVAKLLGR